MCWQFSFFFGFRFFQYKNVSATLTEHLLNVICTLTKKYRLNHLFILDIQHTPYSKNKSTSFYGSAFTFKGYPNF